MRLFKLHKYHCPVKHHDDPFYLTPLRDPKGQFWYSNIPLRYNKLRNAVANVAKQAGIQGYFTNHSLRTTVTIQLYNVGIHEQLVMEQTGHCSLEGIRNYRHTCMQQCETISDVLNCKKMCVNYNEVHSSSISLTFPNHVHFNFTSCGGTINISINNGRAQ